MDHADVYWRSLDETRLLLRARNFGRPSSIKPSRHQHHQQRVECGNPRAVIGGGRVAAGTAMRR